MTRRTVTALPAAFLAALLAVLLAGCTGDPGTDATGGPGAADPAPAPSDQDTVTAAAQALVAAGTARVSVGLDGPTGPLSATGPARFAPFAADLHTDLGAGGTQVRVVGPDAWVRPGGGAWQRLSTGLLPIGAVTGTLHAAPGLRDVHARPGPAEAGGVPATRYDGTVDLAAARAAADPAVAPRLDELSGLVSPTPRFTAWLGAPGAAPADRGRLVQLRLEPPAPATGAPDAGAAVPGAVTLSFSEPGVPVEITAP